MAVAKLDFDVYRGDSFNHQIIWQDDAGVPIDLTNYTARMQCRKSIGGSTVLLTATELDGLVLGGVAGTIDIELPPSKTDILTVDNFYDLEVTSPTAFVTTLIQGSFVVTQDVTRA